MPPVGSKVWATIYKILFVKCELFIKSTHTDTVRVKIRH